jgi:lipopolysaccharide export system protein LptA
MVSGCYTSLSSDRNFLMAIRRTALSTLLALATLFAQVAHGQGTNVAFNGIKGDNKLPVEVNADNLTVNQTDGSAVFSGNVIVIQGDLRLTAGEITVVYAKDGKGIEKLIASGEVLLVNATDAAEAQEAVYTIEAGEVVLTGGVLLTQGQTTISGEKLIIDIAAGTGRMEGRVTTTFTPAGNN